MIALGWVTNIFQRGAASTGRLNYILRATPQIDDRAAKFRTQTPFAGEIEFRNLTFTLSNHHGGQRNSWRSGCQSRAGNGARVSRGPSAAAASEAPAVLQRHQSENSCRLDTRHRGTHGQRQNHASRAHRAPLGSARRPAPDRRSPDSRMAAGQPAPRNRLRAARHLSLHRNRRRQRRLRSSAIRSRSKFATPPKSPASTPKSKDFPEKYDTVVGERGVTLSGGQKQRSAIARAVVRDPRILILDDSLSAVDTQTEERILTRLRGVMDGRTTILISHRTSTVQRCRPDRRLCATAASSNAARTMNFYRATAITPICIASNCWKKSSNAHEQHSRRRSARQSLRRAPDAAVAAISAAVSLERGAGARAGGHRHAARTGATDHLSNRHRQISRASEWSRHYRRRMPGAE